MKYLDEYRDPVAAQQYADAIRRTVTHPWKLMEICGGQTHSIVKYGIDELLPKEVELVHGPGCPVCVTPLELIDKALQIAAQPNVIFCSFGDMLRVPGSGADLFSVKAAGGDVRIVYSPTDAVQIAAQNPDKQVVFFAVGFETTAPGQRDVGLPGEAAGAEELFRAGFACAGAAGDGGDSGLARQPRAGIPRCGHVCTVMGYEEYEPIAKKYQGAHRRDRLRAARPVAGHLHVRVRNWRRDATRSRTSTRARSARKETCLRSNWWQGSFRWCIGSGAALARLPQSGLGLTPEFAEFDAETRFGVAAYTAEEDPECISGLVMQGAKKPEECTAFGKRCTPDHPLGAPMVSSEGACAAYYRYRRLRSEDLVNVGSKSRG